MSREDAVHVRRPVLTYEPKMWQAKRAGAQSKPALFSLQIVTQRLQVRYKADTRADTNKVASIYGEARCSQVF